MDLLLDFSDDFILSSGTVPIDIPKKLVLLISTPKKEYLLPKGYKNVGETLEDAATRETTEDCGYNCCLLEHSLPTNAHGLGGPQHTEPIAVQQRVNSGRRRKIIFWYISEVDSSSPWMRDTKQERGDYNAAWIPVTLAAAKCSFADERRIMEKALEAVFGSAS